MRLVGPATVDQVSKFSLALDDMAFESSEMVALVMVELETASETSLAAKLRTSTILAGGETLMAPVAARGFVSTAAVGWPNPLALDTTPFEA